MAGNASLGRPIMGRHIDAEQHFGIETGEMIGNVGNEQRLFQFDVEFTGRWLGH